MRRRLLNLLTALSLVLCVAACVLWVRSYWRRDDLYLFTPAGRCFVLASYRGGCYGWTEDALSGGWQTAYVSRPPDSHDALDHPQFYLAGFGFTHEAQPPKKWDFYLCRIPIWLFAAVAAGTSLLCVRRRPRGTAGLCSACGYDLRATPDRCPECGTPSAAAAGTV